MHGVVRLRFVAPFLLLLLVASAAPGAAQGGPAATATLEVPEPGPVNGTAVVPFQVTLAVAGFLCLEDATFTVPVAVVQRNTTLAVTLHPQSVSFVVPAGAGLAGSTLTRDAVLAVGPAPPGTRAELALSAGAPEGGCAETTPAERTGDEAEVTLLWSTVPPAPPEQAMPGAPLPLVLAAFWALGQGSRRMGLNRPHP